MGWYERNNFDDNQEYCEKVLKRFGIEKYHYVANGYYTDLIIEQGLKKYKITMNEDNKKMNIYRCYLNLNFKKYTKENMVLKKSFKDDCIWNCIKWIAKDSQIKC